MDVILSVILHWKHGMVVSVCGLFLFVVDFLDFFCLDKLKFHLSKEAGKPATKGDFLDFLVVEKMPLIKTLSS